MDDIRFRGRACGVKLRLAEDAFFPKILRHPKAATAGNLMTADMLPSKFAYTAASIRPGKACATAATAATAEVDKHTGADESDPVGASVASNTLTITATTLAASQVIAVTLDGTIN